MNTSAGGIVGFYRRQAGLMWEWRATRLAIVRRAVLSWLIACAALAVTAALLPGLTIHNLTELLVSGLVLAMLSNASRLVFLWLMVSLPILVAQAASVLFQAAVLLVLGSVVSGVHVADLRTAIVGSLILTFVIALLSELTGAADDDSYHGTLVRQLVARRGGVPHSEAPGMLVVQIDGLSLPVLQSQMRAGRMPVLDRMLRSGEMLLAPWTTMLPSVTPASQAGILHGRNDDIPGFRWYERATQRTMVADHPTDAAEIVRRISDGNGLLAHGGVSIGNLVTGDADRSYLTMATIAADTRRIHGFFVSTVNYVRLLVLLVGEFGKELYQAERQRVDGIKPRMPRGLFFAVERALTNTVLRTLSTALVIEQLYADVPIVYVDFTGYDVIAHHSGPERQEATDALQGIDRSIGSLLKAARETRRPYHLVVLSDHGQSLGTTFVQRYGARLETVVLGLMGETPGATVPPELVVAASGNMALLYFTKEAGRLSGEQIDALYPGLIGKIVAHPGIGVVLLRSAARGLVAISRDATDYLDDPGAEQADVLAPYGSNAAESLRRLEGFSNVGDLVILSAVDPVTHEVLAYEELVGSHGGLGGWQTDPFIYYPAAWPLDSPRVGAPSLYRQLWRWRQALEAEAAAGPRTPA